MKYTACRYGNVVGSTGSVIPLFLKQLEEKGRITITNPDMTRYWISIDDAIKLVQDCLDWVETGCVLIPEPSSMRLGDLAQALINYEGQGGAIDVIGLRPGEKMHEQLLHQQESVRVTRDYERFVLNPVGSKATSEPFILTSNTPKHWLTQDKLINMIQDSLSV